MTPEKEENCGLFGIFGDPEAVQKTYLGLHSLQHRGQESAGIASSNGESIQVYTGMGTVGRVFRAGNDILEKLTNPIATGHVRYSTTGSSNVINCQPFLSEYSRGQVAVAHNGNIINASLLRDEYEAYGSLFKSTSDTEIITHLLAKPSHVGKADPLAHVLNHLQGAYCLLFLFANSIEAARDPYGIRPLCIGQTEKGAYVVASESCAIDAIDAKFIREVEPGEIIFISKEGFKSIRLRSTSGIMTFSRALRTCFSDTIILISYSLIIERDEICALVPQITQNSIPINSKPELKRKN